MRRKSTKPAGSRVSAAALKIGRDQSSETKPEPSAFDDPKLLSAAPLVAHEDNEVSLTADLVAARRRNDLAAVIDMAARLRRLFPVAEPGYQMGAAALRESGELEQAAKVLADATTQFDGKFWLLSELALLAQNSGDWQGAAAAAAVLRERFPEHFLGWRIGLGALQKLDRVEEAGELLDRALGEFPEQEWPVVEALNQALRSGQLQNAALFGETLRRVRPSNPFGWKASINTLRNLGQLAEAEEVTKQAAEKFPGEEWVLSAAVSLAARQGNWPEVCERAAVLRLAFPTNEEGWVLGLRGLRMTRRFEEVAALLKNAEATQPGKHWLLVEAAALAQARGNFAEALQMWKHVREHLPDRHEGYAGLLQVNLALGKLEEAEELLRCAAPSVAQTSWLLSQAAELAHRRGDHEEAARRWSVMLAAFPDIESAYRGSYRGHRALGKLDEADHVLNSALIRFPTARWALTEAAMVAEARFDVPAADRRWESAVANLPEDPEIMLRYATARPLRSQTSQRDWPTTVTRLKALHEKFPFYVDGWRTHILVLRSQGKSQAAEQLAEDCLQRMPDEPSLWLEYALVAGDQGIPERASERLAQAAARFPKSEVIQSNYAQSLARIGRFQEAECLYQNGLQNFSESADMACGYAANAASQQDWPEALQRWTAALRKFPLDRRAGQGLLDAQAALGDRVDNLNLSGSTNDSALQSDRERLYLQFESLGGTGQGCEFGLVQRAAGGVEPLGLLRFSQILPEKLVEALESRFEGIGSPEQTVIDFFETEDFEAGNEPGNLEYRYNDRRFDTVMHTHIYKKDMPRDTMFVQTCRRMTFLRRKLIQDLEDGEKIFVYKIFHKNMETDELSRLYRAMRGYGNNTLLYVRYADERNPSGTVRRVDCGLLVGYISGFSMSYPDGQARAPDVPSWTRICKAASALHLAERQKDTSELHEGRIKVFPTVPASVGTM